MLCANLDLGGHSTRTRDTRYAESNGLGDPALWNMNLRVRFFERNGRGNADHVIGFRDNEPHRSTRMRLRFFDFTPLAFCNSIEPFDVDQFVEYVMDHTFAYGS